MRICAQCQSTVNWSKDYCPLCSAPLAPEEQKTGQPAVNDAPPLNAFADGNQPSEQRQEQIDQPMELKAQIPTQNFNHNETPPPMEKGQQPAPKLTVGSVLKQTYATLRSNPAVFFGLAFINVLTMILGDIAKDLLGATLANIIYFFSLPIGILTNGAFIYATVRAIRGNTATIGKSLSHSISRILTMLFASFLVFLMSFLILLPFGLAFWAAIVNRMIGLRQGFLLLAIITLIASVAMIIITSALASACFVEGLGAIKSIKRSVELTKNNRIKILGIFSTAMIITVVIFGVIGFFGGVIVGFISAMLSLDGRFMLSLLFKYPTMLVTVAFFSVMFPVIYCKLREIKEGTAIESLAKVFD